MFAFALWDAKQHRLFIARDPMGIKPLYYAQAGSYFVFASEVRTLVGTGLLRPRISAAGLINYLTFGSNYDPLTLVEGTRASFRSHAHVGRRIPAGVLILGSSRSTDGPGRFGWVVRPK